MIHAFISLNRQGHFDFIGLYELRKCIQGTQELVSVHQSFSVVPLQY